MSKDNKQQNTQPPEEPAKEVPETEETSCPEGNPSQAPLPEETPEPSELEKAQAEGIPVLVSPETNYSLAGKLYQLGIH